MTGWGLIGASTIAAQYMIKAFRAQEGHEVVSVLSSDAQRGAAYAETHNIAQATTDLAELLANPAVGCVYISTTNEKHFDQAMAAIAAGKHVLCEKPLALSREEAETMVKAAQEKGVVFATNHHLRNAGSHQAIKQAIADGKLGDILSIRIFHAVYLPENLQGWRLDSAAAGGGVILDIVVHDADTVRFYLDEDPKRVVGFAQASGLGKAGVEDSSMTVWQMPSGVMVQTHESFTHPHAGSGLEIHGTKGTIRAKNVMTQRPIGEVTLITAEGEENLSYEDHDLYTKSMAAFAAAIKGQGRPSADGVDGVKSLAVALAVKQATETGQAVDVDYGGL